MINVSLFRQYHFCKRIVYFSLLTNIKPVMPKHTEFGKDFHQKETKLSKARKFKKLNIDFIEVLTDLYIESEKLDINGVVDLCFITESEVVPVEFKYSSKKPSFAYRLQVVGYGKILEEKYNKPFKRGYIIYDNNLKYHSIALHKNLEDRFFKTLQSIKDIEKEGIFPNSSADESKCLQCEYLNFCDDRF